MSFLSRNVTLIRTGTVYRFHEVDGTALPLNAKGYATQSGAYAALLRFYAVGQYLELEGGNVSVPLHGMAHPNRKIAPRDEVFVGRMLDHDIAQEVKAREAARSAAPTMVPQPVQQAQGQDTRAASGTLARVADAVAELASCDPVSHPFRWNILFDARERAVYAAINSDAVAYVRAYPSSAFAYRHLLPADMVARIEAAETDADMVEAVREPTLSPADAVAQCEALRGDGNRRNEFRSAYLDSMPQETRNEFYRIECAARTNS